MKQGAHFVVTQWLNRVSRRIASLIALGALATGLSVAGAQNFLINKKFVDVVGVPNNQVNVLGPAQTSYLEFNMFNSATGPITANMTDVLPAGLLADTTFTPVVTDWTGTAGANGCTGAGAALSATSSTISISNFSYPNTPAAGVLPDCRVVFRVIGNPSAMPVGSSNVTNTVVGASQTSATGPGGPYNSQDFSASLQVLPIINATVGKAFNPTSVPINGNSVMTFTITNNASYPLNNATLTDALPAGAIPQTSPTPTSNCGGSVAVAAQNVTLSGGTVPASGTCTVTVTVKGTVAGTVTNNIPSNSLTTTEGVTNSNAASAPLTVLNTLTMEKFHNSSSLVALNQGQVYVTQIRFTNYNPALTNASVTDNLPAGLALAANPGFNWDCGGVASGTPGGSTITVTGMTIPAANLATGAPGVCNIYVNTVVTASSGSITNTIPVTNVSNDQGQQPVAPAQAAVTVSPAPGPGGAPGGGNWGSVGVQKGYSEGNGAFTFVDQGQPFWMYLSAFNPGYDWRYTGGTMTDVLPLGLQVDVPAVAGGPAYTPVSGTDIWYQNWHTSSNAGPNNTGSPTGSWYPGCANTGQVTVTRAVNGQDTITYSGWSTKALSELPTGLGANWYNSGCWFNIRVKGVTPGAYIGGSAPNQPINFIPVSNITTTEGVTNPVETNAPVTILSVVGVEKTFNPHVIVGGSPAKTTRLTIWLTNKSATAQTNSALTDTLPTGSGWTVLVASPPNASTTCVGGTVAATAGGATVAISGATIPAGTVATPGKCSFSVDVAVTGPAGDNGPLWNIIPPGALTTATPNLTNVVEARASLYTRARNVVLNKTFGNGGAAQGGTPVPMTITLTGDRWELNNITFTDNLVSVQPGLVVAPNPNISTTCRTVDLAAAPFVWTDTLIYRQSLTPPTVTAVAGSTTVSLSGAYFPGQDYIDNGMTGQINSCTITLDVVASTTGNKTNTIPASNVTTTEGATNLSPTSATLTVQPNTQLVKAFNPTSVSVGTPFTLTFTIFNVNTSPQADFNVTDALPANILATSVASNTCGGTLTTTGGGTGISLAAPGTSVAANGSCQFVLNMVGNTTGTYTNNQSNITATAPINTTTTTTVTVTAPTTFDLTIAKAIDASTPAPYFPGVSQVKFNLTATNNGPGPSQQNIVVKDCLPTGLSYVSAAGTGWSCANTAGPLTRGALTCSSEIVCTRNAGGTIASGGSANPIQVTANVTAAASGTLVNYAQVNPAAGETLVETNLLGSTNGGYETGSPTVGSNNDASASITASAVYALGNRVWYDTNNNGILDAGEQPIASVRVQLLDSAGAAIAGQTVLTDSNGYYRFDALAAGTYSVQITPDNWTGVNGSYPVGTPGGSLVVVGGSTPLAGYLSSTPTDSAANSTGTGSINNTDKGINPGTAAAYTANGVSSNPVTLGAGNQPSVSDVDSGAVGAGANTASGDASDNLTVDFGFYRLTVGNEVFYDIANNGIKDGADAGVAGVTVELLKGGTVVATTTTNASGLYSFTQGTNAAGVANGQPLIPGADYQVRLPGTGIPAGYSSSTDIVSTSNPTAVGNGVNSDDNGKVVGSTIISDNFTLQAGTLPAGAVVSNAATAVTDNPTIDFGLTPSYSLGNRVWFDTNNDGILNNGETPAAGVKVQLLDSTGNAIAGQVVLTDANGYYRFDGLGAGTYAVQIAPDNWTGLSGNLPQGTTAGASTAATGRPLAGYQSSTVGSNGVTGVTTGTGSTNNNDKGINPTGAYAAAGVKSGNVVLGSGNQPTVEVDAGAAGAGLNGPTGDAYDNLTVDFGFFRLTVGDTVWRDDGAGTAANFNNGIRDSGEPALAGVALELRKAGTLVAVTTTDSNGFYIFTQQTDATGTGTGEPLVAGTDYTIAIPANQSALAGLRSSATPGTQPTVNSVGTGTLDDGDKGTGTAATTSVTATAAFTLDVSSTGAVANANNTYGRAQANVDNGTSHKPDMDFGFVPSFAIGNRVWFDTNNNGTIDATEVGINGALVELTDTTGAKLYRTSATDPTPTTSNTGIPIEMSTANGGYYLFDNLPAGTFRVRVAASNWSAANGALRGYSNSTGVTNQGASLNVADNNRDHGTDPANAAAYASAGVSSADIALGTSTVGTGDTTEVGGSTGTPPTSVVGNANDNLTIDFGFYRLSVGNLVWSDSGAGGGVYNDGIRNGSEPALAGVGVQLLDSSGTVVAQTITDGNGNYVFNQLSTAPAPTGTGSNLVYAAGVANGQPILSGNYTVRIPANQAALSGATSSVDTANGRTTADSQDNGVGTAFATGNTDTSAFALTPGSTAIGSTPTDSNGTTDQPRIDFGFVPGFAIGNRIWYDTNNNGAIDAGEAVIPNVVVELLDGSGNVIKTTATNATGEYLFESLGTGNYTVRVPKENWTGLTAAQVTAAGNPSGVAAGQKPLAGYSNSTGAGAVGASATDATDKGVDVADPTVAGISSAQIALGVGLQPLNESNTADNDGVGPTTSVDANNNMTIDFGFYRLTVGDLVWRDDGNNGATPANVNNGLRDNGEAGITGVRVELYLGATLVAVATTDANGNYLFDQGTDSAGVANGKPLVPGTTYQVRIPQATTTVNTALINLASSAANGVSETTPLGANHDDSGVGVGAASAGITPSVNFTLGAGTSAGANSVPTNATGTTAQPNVDFGFAPSYSLGNRVWVDSNNNGIMDSGEAGLANVTVRLLDPSGNPVAGVANQMTDGNGYYRFDGLQPGNYIVEIVPGAVNGVNYVSSTGQNASATGAYEPGTSATAASSNDRDHGTQTTPITIRSNPITLGPTNLVSGEVNAGATNAGANGPNGDMFDVLTGDFGVFLPAKLGNFVWYDSNHNGRADPGETGLNDVLVILTDSNGTEVARQLTRNNPTGNTPGYYQFDNLIPGSYYVTFLPDGAWLTTVPGTPSITTGTGPDLNDSQPAGNQRIGRSQTVTLAAGDNNPQLDAGFYPAGPIPTLTEAMRNLLALMVLVAAFVALRRKAGGLR